MPPHAGRHRSLCAALSFLSSRVVACLCVALGAGAIACASAATPGLGPGVSTADTTPATAEANVNTQSGRGSASPVGAEAISEITLERHCFGCSREFKLVLRRDGTVTRTTFGNARLGTSDRESTATAAPAAFADLARVVIANELFDLLDVYRDPAMADGEWAVTTVTAGGRQKSVLDRDGLAPAALLRVQARIEDLGNNLAWRDVLR